MIKCLLLKTGITVVSEMLEVGAEVGEPDCRLVNPCEITENGQLRRWAILHGSEISYDWI